MKANRIKLSPEKITAWWQMLRAFLIARVPELKVVLSDDEKLPGNGTSRRQK